VKFIKTIALLFSLLCLFSCSSDPVRTTPPVVATIPLSLLQYQWNLTGIDGQPLALGISSELKISSANKATGNLACNYFFGSPRVYENKFKIEKLASTRSMCRGKAGEVETIVAAVLSNWSEVQLADDGLTLIGKSHRLNYKRKQ
jgi:heat shock protein HslJ